MKNKIIKGKLLMLGCIMVMSFTACGNQTESSWSNDTKVEVSTENQSEEDASIIVEGSQNADNSDNSVVEFDDATMKELTEWQGTSEIDSSLFRGSATELADKLNSKQYIIAEQSDGTYLYYKLDNPINSNYFTTANKFGKTHDYFLNSNACMHLDCDMKYTAFRECLDIDGTKQVLDLNILTSASSIKSENLLNTIGQVEIYEDSEFHSYLLVPGSKINFVASVESELAEGIAAVLNEKVGVAEADSKIVSEGALAYDFVEYYIYSRYGIKDSEIYQFTKNDFDSYNLINKNDSDDYIITQTPYEINKMRVAEDDKILDICGKEFKYHVEEQNADVVNVKIYMESQLEEGIGICFSRSYRKADFATEEDMVENFKKIMEGLVEKQ